MATYTIHLEVAPRFRELLDYLDYYSGLHEYIESITFQSRNSDDIVKLTPKMDSLTWSSMVRAFWQLIAQTGYGKVTINFGKNGDQFTFIFDD